MNTTRRSTKLLALAATSALVFAACGSDDDEGSGDEESATTEATEGTEATDGTEAPDEEAGDEEAGDAAAAGADGGTLIWAHEQEPPDLHLDDPENNLGITSWVRAAMIEGLYGISSTVEYYPELLAEEAALVENDDGTVTVDFALREGLTWSDGDDLTADDVKFTFDMQDRKSVV